MQKKASFEDYQIKIISFISSKKRKPHTLDDDLSKNHHGGEGGGTLEYLINRRTFQIIIGNRKTEIKFDQNRKPQAKPEKTCRWFRSSRRIFSAEKPEKHQTASNSKSENSILFLPKIENEMEQERHTATDTKTEKPISKMAETVNPTLSFIIKELVIPATNHSGPRALAYRKNWPPYKEICHTCEISTNPNASQIRTESAWDCVTVLLFTDWMEITILQTPL